MTSEELRPTGLHRVATRPRGTSGGRTPGTATRAATAHAPNNAPVFGVSDSERFEAVSDLRVRFYDLADHQ